MNNKDNADMVTWFNKLVSKENADDSDVFDVTSEVTDSSITLDIFSKDIKHLTFTDELIEQLEQLEQESEKMKFVSQPIVIVICDSSELNGINTMLQLSEQFKKIGRKCEFYNVSSWTEMNKRIEALDVCHFLLIDAPLVAEADVLASLYNDVSSDMEISLTDEKINLRQMLFLGQIESIWKEMINKLELDEYAEISEESFLSRFLSVVISHEINYTETNAYNIFKGILTSEYYGKQLVKNGVNKWYDFSNTLKNLKRIFSDEYYLVLNTYVEETDESIFLKVDESYKDNEIYFSKKAGNAETTELIGNFFKRILEMPIIIWTKGEQKTYINRSISHIESTNNGREMIIYLTNNCKDVIRNKKLTEVFPSLPPNFIQIARGTVVNLENVDKFLKAKTGGSPSLLMKNGISLNIRRESEIANAVKKLVESYKLID